MLGFGHIFLKGGHQCGQVVEQAPQVKVNGAKTQRGLQRKCRSEPSGGSGWNKRRPEPGTFRDERKDRPSRNRQAVDVETGEG